MAHYGTFSFVDVANQSSSYSFYNGPITAVSLPGYLTQFGALRDATDAISLCTISDEKWVGDETSLSNVLPTDAYARREIKLSVTYQGNTSGKLFHVTVPGPDLANLDWTGETVNIADGGIMAAWVTAFEDVAKSPNDDTEDVTVISARIVGRNL